MTNRKLPDLGHSQRDRLAFIELRVRFIGELRRQDLAERFGIQTAAATRDLALYKEMAPANMVYDSRAKEYVVGTGFQPLFDFSPERVLAWLAEGFGDGDPVSSRVGISCAIPTRLAQPDLDILSRITRAISRGCALRMTYHSVSSGRSRRDIVPFALIDTGLRWHVRAFDRKSREFRDFVITRIQNPEVLDDCAVEEHERSAEDAQWTRIVEVILVPHPDKSHPEITEMDFGMRDGVLTLRLRAATAGYALRKWSVDCSEDHRLSGPEFRLWLKDPLVLYGVQSAQLAPGYALPSRGTP